MEIKLNSKDRIRIVADYEHNNFIDVGTTDNELAINIDLYPSFHYIEIRKKRWKYKGFLI